MKFASHYRESSGNRRQGRAFYWYLASVLVLGIGSMVSARHYPGGFDWRYTVASALASHSDNPSGSAWFAGALGMAMVLLWPYVSALKKDLAPSPSAAAGFAIAALRTGLVCGTLLGLEGFFVRDLSVWVNKGHEILGILTFAGLYIGVVVFLVPSMFRRRFYVVPALLIAIPLLAIGITQFWLYLAQRDVGWVGANWKATGIPVCLSFAFWQWLAMGFLTAGLGLLPLVPDARNRARPSGLPS